MRGHLSGEEISQYVLGDAGAGVEEHFGECAGCRAEVELFRVSLTSFRGCVHQWADEQRGSDVATIKRIRQAPVRLWIHAVSGVTVAALLCLVAIVGIERTGRANRESVEDAVLLGTMQQDLSQKLPDSLAPLSAAVDWERTGGR